MTVTDVELCIVVQLLQSFGSLGRQVCRHERHSAASVLDETAASSRSTRQVGRRGAASATRVRGQTAVPPL